MALTPQQEAFAQGVASGKSQAEAYRAAYPKSCAWTTDAVCNRASAMMRHSGILARVGSIRAELAEKGLWSREESVKALRQVVLSPDKQSDVVAAVKELNAMHGFNAPTKIEHGGLTIVIDKPGDDE